MARLHEGQAKEVSRGFERSTRARRMIAYWQVDKLEFRLLFFASYGSVNLQNCWRGNSCQRDSISFLGQIFGDLLGRVKQVAVRTSIQLRVLTVSERPVARISESTQ